MSKINVVHFGTGNIGRGLIADIYQKSNFQITFIDTNQTLVQKLNETKQYKIIDIETKQETIISNYQALLFSDQEKVLNALKKCQIISTSVGSNNLKYLKNILSQLASIDVKQKSLICFENGFRISDVFKKELDFKNNWNFINASTDRIVPIVENSTLDVFVESFYEIVLENIVQKLDFKLKDVIYTDNLDEYILRKLFMVNALHSGIAYLGYRLKGQYIQEVIKRQEVRSYIEQMKNLIIDILIKDSKSFNKIALQTYAYKIIKRFENPFLKDLVIRVARNPLTKISKNERYDLLLKKAKEIFLNTNHLDIVYQTFVNILFFNSDSDEQAPLMQQMIKSDLKEFLKNYTDIDDVDSDRIIQLYYKQKLTMAKNNE